MTPRASSPTGMVGGSGRGGAGGVARVRALGANGDGDLDAAIEALADRAAGSTVLTPHDGEFERITGRGPGEDRVGAVLRLARATGAIVLLKGPTTVVAAPDGRVDLVRSGDSRLATAGSGDVLSGIIAALLAQGLAPFEAAACGAYVHGAASLLGHSHGLVAGDIAELLPRWWDSCDH